MNDPKDIHIAELEGKLTYAERALKVVWPMLVVVVLVAVLGGIGLFIYAKSCRAETKELIETKYVIDKTLMSPEEWASSRSSAEIGGAVEGGKR